MSTTFAGAVPGPDGRPLDRIRLTGLSATGHHGVYEHERIEGQLFRADVVLHLDTRPAAQGDDLDDTVSYAVVADEVVAILAGSPADLVETVAERVAAVVLTHPAVEAVDVTVHKPQAPLTVPFDDVEVTIRRDRTKVPVVAARRAGVGPADESRAHGGTRREDSRSGHVVSAPIPVGSVGPAIIHGADVSGVTGPETSAHRVIEVQPEPAPVPTNEPEPVRAEAPAAAGPAAPAEPVAQAAPAASGERLAPTPEPARGLPEPSEAVTAEQEPVAPAAQEADEPPAAYAEPAAATPAAPEPVAVATPATASARAEETPAPGPAEPERERDRMDEVPADFVEVVLALGANLGDAQQTLRDAITDLDRISGLEITEVSPLARTAAVGGPEQPDFLNTVLLARTKLSARDLLHACQGVERLHGRVRDEHWGPRTLDVDLIVYGSLTAVADDIELPHPRAHQRAFVLEPWSQIDPDAVLPGLGGGPVQALAATAPDRDGIRWLALDWLTDPAPAYPGGHDAPGAGAPAAGGGGAPSPVPAENPSDLEGTSTRGHAPSGPAPAVPAPVRPAEGTAPGQHPASGPYPTASADPALPVAGDAYVPEVAAPSTGHQPVVPPVSFPADSVQSRSVAPTSVLASAVEVSGPAAARGLAEGAGAPTATATMAPVQVLDPVQAPAQDDLVGGPIAREVDDAPLGAQPTAHAAPVRADQPRPEQPHPVDHPAQHAPSSEPEGRGPALAVVAESPAQGPDPVPVFRPVNGTAGVFTEVPVLPEPVFPDTALQDPTYADTARPAGASTAPAFPEAPHEQAPAGVYESFPAAVLDPASVPAQEPATERPRPNFAPVGSGTEPREPSTGTAPNPFAPVNGAAPVAGHPAPEVVPAQARPDAAPVAPQGAAEPRWAPTQPEEGQPARPSAFAPVDQGPLPSATDPHHAGPGAQQPAFQPPITQVPPTFPVDPSGPAR